MVAIRAFINTWLKDKSVYCNYCGLPFNPKDQNEHGQWNPCCENPQIGRNVDHTMGIIKQNRAIRETRKNDFAQTDSKAMRMGISLPPMLLKDLENYFKKNYDQKLFVDNKELHKFMREFPDFTTCRRI